MAVQVLDCQGLPTLQRHSDDTCEVMSASLQNMHQLMNFLSQKQMRQAQDAYSHIPDAAVSDFKKTTLAGGLGHARFRRGSMACPSGASPASLPSPPLFQMPSNHPSRDRDSEHAQVRSSPCHDATEPARTSDRGAPLMHPICTGRPCIKESPNDGDAHVANACTDNMHTIHVSHICAATEKEPNVHGSVYDASVPRNLNVHGHARCRDATKIKTDNQAFIVKPFSARSCAEKDQAVLASLRMDSSLVSSLSIEERGGTISSGKPLFSSARPPLPPMKRKAEKIEDVSRKCHKAGQCHCAHKHRKLQSRTVVRVPVITNTSNTEISLPDDGYSWCLYGKKLVEDSIHPRVYYKCSSDKSCPARKHVQRASEDLDILIVTYGRKHVHPQIFKVPVQSR